MARITNLIDEDPEIIEAALRHPLQAETCKVIGELIVALRTLERPIDYTSSSKEPSSNTFSDQLAQAQGSPEAQTNIASRRSGGAGGHGVRAGAITPLDSSRPWPVIADASVVELGRVAIGGGARGVNLHLAARDLVAHLNADVADVTHSAHPNDRITGASKP